MSLYNRKDITKRRRLFALTLRTLSSFGSSYQVAAIWCHSKKGSELSDSSFILLFITSWSLILEKCFFTLLITLFFTLSCYNVPMLGEAFRGKTMVFMYTTTLANAP